MCKSMKKQTAEAHGLTTALTAGTSTHQRSTIASTTVMSSTPKASAFPTQYNFNTKPSQVHPSRPPTNSCSRSPTARKSYQDTSKGDTSKKSGSSSDSSTKHPHNHPLSRLSQYSLPMKAGSLHKFQGWTRRSSRPHFQGWQSTQLNRHRHTQLPRTRFKLEPNVQQWSAHVHGAQRKATHRLFIFPMLHLP